jgi:uncharacterized protein
MNRAPAMTPVSTRERIGVIDILRGLALFGILTANMRGFNAPLAVYDNISFLFGGLYDRMGQSFVDLVFQGKFITLFAFLFGLGFAVQMTRAQERGISVAFYRRRLLVLLGIGCIHAWLIWSGDILIPYALTGFVLLFFRNKSQRDIARTALSFYAGLLVTLIGFYIAAQFGIKGPMSGDAPKPQDVQHAIAAYRDGSYFDMVRQRWSEWRDIAGVLPLILCFVLPRFLAGLWVWRSGLLQDVPLYLPRVRQVWKWSLAAGIALSAIVFSTSMWFDMSKGVTNLPGLIHEIANEIALPTIACFYACSVLLAVQSPEWRVRLEPFGAVGRTALSNYLLQSLVFTWLYRLTGLYGKVGPAMGLIPTVVFFSIQVPLSVWWLKRYQFGPAEWVWRSLTYGARQPMRKQTDAPVFRAAAIAPGRNC